MPQKILSDQLHIDCETGILVSQITNMNKTFTAHSNQDYYEVFYPLSSNIMLEVNDKTYSVSTGAIVFLRPQDYHKYCSYDGNEFSYVNIAFDESTKNDLFQFLSSYFPSKEMCTWNFPPFVQLDALSEKWLYNQIQSIQSIEPTDKKQIKLRARILLVEIFSRFFSSFPENDCTDENAVPEWLITLCKQMNKHANYSTGISRMVELSGKSREYIARSIKKYYHKSPTEYINSIRLDYIANMLQNSNLPILDICYNSGFYNVSWAYTSFKKKYGITMNQMRKNLNYLGITEISNSTDFSPSLKSSAGSGPQEFDPKPETL